MTTAGGGRIGAAFAVHGYLADIVRVKFAAGLAKGSVVLRFFPDQNIRRCAETLGIPRFEIGRVLVDGAEHGVEERLSNESAAVFAANIQ